MKARYWIIAAAALSFVQLAPANATVVDPEVIIYRFPGVRDNGGGTDTGVATVFHCTNFSGTTETLRFVTRGFEGVLIQNTVVPILHLQTKTVSTHDTVAYNDDVNLATGLVRQGTTAIAATSTSVICTAMTIDASTAAPVGVALRGIRFSPAPGSQE